MYGLLFNPLASAFSALLLIIILNILNSKDVFLYVLLTAIIVLALSRSTILVTAALLIYIITQNNLKLMLSLMLPIALGAIIYYINEIYTLATQAVLMDETGSISEHLKNYTIGFTHIFSSYGEGFRDARIFGAWNIRLESMPLQYALTGGIGQFFPLIILIAILCKQTFKAFGTKNGLSILFFAPIFFSFPIHTFNLPTTLFALLLCLWAGKKSLLQRNIISACNGANLK
ncbi:hypothetical protein D9M71_104320 [compost metagenome]